MKSIVILVLLFAVHSISAQTTFEKWPAIKELHEVVSPVFHSAEAGDLLPLKTRSGELMMKAEALLKLNIPEEFRTNEILSAAERLQLEGKALHQSVLAKVSDAELTKSITAFHNTFHLIIGFCGPN